MKKQVQDEWERQHPTPAHGAGSGWLSGMFGSVAAVCPPFAAYRGLMIEAKLIYWSVAWISEA
jgi:hypothetical protein